MSARPRRDRRTRFAGRRRRRPAARLAGRGRLHRARPTRTRRRPEPVVGRRRRPSSSSPGRSPCASRCTATRAVVAAYRGWRRPTPPSTPTSPSRSRPRPTPSRPRTGVDRGFDAGTPPTCSWPGRPTLPALVADGRVQPVDELLEKRGVQFGDNYQRIGLEAFAADSALQCMPNDVSPYVVFYNKRLLVPRTSRAARGDPAEPRARLDAGSSSSPAARGAVQGRRQGRLPPARAEHAHPAGPLGRRRLIDDERKPTTLTFADDATRARARGDPLRRPRPEHHPHRPPAGPAGRGHPLRERPARR